MEEEEEKIQETPKNKTMEEDPLATGLHSKAPAGSAGSTEV